MKNYEDLLEILYPGYSKMSGAKKEAIEMRAFEVIRYSREIKILLGEMKNPKSPLYQKNLDDKALINIALIYSRIYEDTRRINKPTGRVVRGGDYYDEPRDEYQNVRATDSEQEQLMAIAIQEYSRTHKIRVRNLISKITKREDHEINIDTALRVKQVLDSVLGKESKKLSTDEPMIQDEERR